MRQINASSRLEPTATFCLPIFIRITQITESHPNVIAQFPVRFDNLLVGLPRQLLAHIEMQNMQNILLVTDKARLREHLATIKTAAKTADKLPFR